MIKSFEDFVKKVATSTNKLDILKFYQENPSAIDSPEGLSRWINRDVFEIENELEELAEKGILLKEGGLQHPLYRYNPSETIASYTTNLLQARSFYEKKIAELEKEKISMSDRFTREIIHERGKTKKIIENMAEGILVINKKNQVLTINSQAKNIFYITAADTSGKDIFSLISNFEIREIMQSIIEQKHTKEIKIKNENDENIYKVTVSPLKDDPLGDDSGAASELVGNIIVLSDITREKEIERFKADFISMVTHDIKNPLNTIILNSTFLIEKYGKGRGDNFEKFLKMISDSGKKILKLIDEFLNLSRIEAGIIKLNLQKANYADLIKNVIQNHLRQAENKGINIEVTVPPEPVVLEIDHLQIERVCSNLLDNAIKFTQKGGTISINVRVQEKGAITSVSDTGSGISESELPLLFDKYFRAKTSGKIKGTGLGLAIAKSIIEAHGGVINVESRIAEGTKFLFYLPAKPDK